MPQQTANAIEQFNAIVAQHQQAGLSKSQATRKAAVENQELHAEYLAAYKSETKKGKRPGAARR